ncbi:PREDICTED: cuticle protein 18.7-like [Eufriesea mexicana]|uniref:cuticle protein 18.7-like n=1 Tax=Eufriesea mexicana TaxID=516756 RepID=UPI00083C26FD|nr:PREDICTED: cuticle protein 18.7-like [Eufriesea mexicana]
MVPLLEKLLRDVEEVELGGFELGANDREVILVTIYCLVIAKAEYVGSVLPYNHLNVRLVYDDKVLDTPEVAHAKAAHLATQAYEAARNTLGYAHVPALLRVYAPAVGAPIGVDGRVVDTPEVAEAKAVHLATHALEAAKKLGLYPYGALAYTSIPYIYGSNHGAPLGPDGRVVDTPEVTEAKAAHLAAHAQEAAKISGKR